MVRVRARIRVRVRVRIKVRRIWNVLQESNPVTVWCDGASVPLGLDQN